MIRDKLVEMHLPSLQQAVKLHTCTVTQFWRTKYTCLADAIKNISFNIHHHNHNRSHQISRLQGMYPATRGSSK